MSPYACREASRTYVIHRQTRMTEEMYLGTVGPPSSALPKKLRLRRSMSRVMATQAHRVYRRTLKPKAGSFTRNGEF